MAASCCFIGAIPASCHVRFRVAGKLLPRGPGRHRLLTLNGDGTPEQPTLNLCAPETPSRRSCVSQRTAKALRRADELLDTAGSRGRLRLSRARENALSALWGTDEFFDTTG